jgi:pimeloyl-ACP methyl ester carboxylesterase
MQSNVVAMSGPDQAASERAATLAIQQSGISASDEVIFVGHSQGGMVAGNLAANPGNYIVSGLLTFGAPLAQLNLTKFPVMAVEHINDPVPNVSGKANPMRSNWVTVQRNSSQKESEALLHSHSLESYRNTSGEIDQEHKSGIQRIREKLLGATRGSKTGTALDFVISREF